ncbi:unnamed protein product [Dovyalis caffra]|uniref:EGF-like domain-containing protein n=1 Tax=Dovyalis caffra TaxID=77055 RepID=A0AAV1S331_9ROSI|nr:unnamed protein product [Dovyalis caffra]
MAMQVVFQIIFLFWSLNPFLAEAQPITKSGCQDRCGNISIPYPFGMQPGCYLEESFRIDCNSSSTPRLSINGINLELTKISVDSATTIQINFPIIFQNCSNKNSSSNAPVVDMEGSPFAFSTTNRLVAVGCGNLTLLSRNESTVQGCMANCSQNSSAASANTTGCNGINCCQTTIPSDLDFFNATLTDVDDNGKNQCKYAYLVDQNWFFNLSSSSNISVIRDMDFVPVMLDWRIDSGSYEKLVANGSAYNLTYLTSSGTSTCNMTGSQNSSGVLECSCLPGFQGNPYLPDGCHDINECEYADNSYNATCSGDQICINSYGSYTCVKLGSKKSPVKMVLLAEAQVLPLSGIFCGLACGDVSIPYPFGMEKLASCYLEEGYKIHCNSSEIPILSINGADLEVTDI